MRKRLSKSYQSTSCASIYDYLQGNIMKKHILTTALLASICMGTAMASPALTEDQVGEMATSYFKSHPEQMMDILKHMQSSMQQKSLNQSKQAVIDGKAVILGDDSFLPSIGNPHASKTLLFVFDFQCVYCHKEAPLIAKLIKENKDLRVVMMPLHFFGKASLYANKVALYANSIGKFKAFYQAMEEAGLIEGKLNNTAVNLIMKKVGIDQQKFEQALKKGDIDDQIKQIDTLAKQINVQGTPFMAVMPSDESKLSTDDITLLPGYVSFDALKSAVDE